MMYSFCVTDQLLMFVRSVAFGILLGTVRSIVFFVCGIFIQRTGMRCMVTDIVFSPILALSAFCFVLAFDLGRLRFYAALGVLFGVFCFVNTFGKTLGFVFDKAAALLSSVVRGIFRPLKAFFEKIRKKFNKKSPEYIANKNKNVV